MLHQGTHNKNSIYKNFWRCSLQNTRQKFTKQTYLSYSNVWYTKKCFSLKINKEEGLTCLWIKYVEKIKPLNGLQHNAKSNLHLHFLQVQHQRARHEIISKKEINPAVLLDFIWPSFASRQGRRSSGRYGGGAVRELRAIETCKKIVTSMLVAVQQQCWPKK